jgi:Ca2+-binding RTX toxin-like protein
MWTALQSLERRVMLSATDPSGREQETLELLNRFRANPQAELPILLNSTDPNVQSALSFFNVDRTLAAQQFATLAAEPPLAWNSDLATAALAHSQAMLAADSQQHQLPGEQDLVTRIVATGYTGYSSLRESIYAYDHTTFEAHAAFAIDWGTGPGGMQSPPGHRQNATASDVREVGIGFIDGNGTGSGNPHVGPSLVTEDFGARFSQTNPYLLGVAFTDTNGDGYYEAGEGLAGLTVHITGTGGTFNTTTLSAGGYQIVVPAGTYSVTVSGTGLPQAITYQNVVVGTDNKKLDFHPTDSFASFGNGVLSIPGTAAADTITATMSAGYLVVSRDNVSEQFAPAAIHELAITGGAGGDHITVDSSVTIPCMINGGKGPDSITGGSGNDTLAGGRGLDTILGGLGDDLINGGKGGDSLAGGGGNDSITGGPGHNVLSGGDGNDTLFAVNGVSDTLSGGAGSDVAYRDLGLDSVGSDIESVLA